MLLSASADLCDAVRKSALQLLCPKRERLHSRLLHRIAKRVLEAWLLGSSSWHLQLALLWPFGEGRRDTPW